MLGLQTIKFNDRESIHEFNAKFNELVYKSNLMDGPTCMAYYRRALPNWLRSRAGLSFPVPTNIEQWIGRATEIFEQNVINKNIEESLHPTNRKRPLQANVRRTSAEEIETSKKSDTSTSEVNKMTFEERSRHMQQNLCFFCHKPGHQARDCSNRVRKKKIGRKPDRKIREIIEEQTSDLEKEGDEEETDDEVDTEDEFDVDAVIADLADEDSDF